MLARLLWSRGLMHMPVAARFWDCGFESRCGHGCFFLVNVVCCVGKGPCDWPIPLPGNPAKYVCVSMCVIS